MRSTVAFFLLVVVAAVVVAFVLLVVAAAVVVADFSFLFVVGVVVGAHVDDVVVVDVLLLCRCVVGMLSYCVSVCLYSNQSLMSSIYAP